MRSINPQFTVPQVYNVQSINLQFAIPQVRNARSINPRFTNQQIYKPQSVNLQLTNPRPRTPRLQPDSVQRTRAHLPTAPEKANVPSLQLRFPARNLFPTRTRVVSNI